MDDTNIIQEQFPPNVPQKLISEFHACEDVFRVLARKLEVNPAHIYKLLVYGKEPRDRDIREKLFLPAKVREEVPSWVIQATEVLAKLESKAPPVQNRIYNRAGKRVR